MAATDPPAAAATTTGDEALDDLGAPDGDEPDGDLDGPGALDGSSRTRSAVRAVFEWAAVIVAALAVAAVVKTYLLQAFYIPSGSMEHTLEIDDRVLVNKLSYRLHDVHRGDVVVFERPEDESGDPAIKDLIKRVVGLPGETVEVADGRVLIDGRPLAEPYLDPGTETFGSVRVTVPPDHLWVMGDNRGNSADSRVFGPIDEDLVVGRAFARVWPVTQVHLL